MAAQRTDLLPLEGFSSEATLCGDKTEPNKAPAAAADPLVAAVLVNHSKQLEILSKGIISGSGALGP